MERPRRLSAAFVKTVSAPGRYGDGRGGFGLSLLVKATTTGRASKSWSQRLRIHSQPFNLGLGGYPLITLAEARSRALANARAVEEGIDPRVKVTAVPTFQEATERTIEILRPNWKPGSKTEKQLRYLIAEYALPRIGKKPVDAITPGDVLGFLAPLAVGKPETARKLRVQLNQVFKWAVSQGLRADNPADQSISHGLPKMGTKQHRKALPYNEVAAALDTVRNSRAWVGTKLALEFLALTAARSGEVRLATWAEMNLESATWTVPPGRMKAQREHRVPLSDRAVQILTEARLLGGGEGLVFPSTNGGKPPSDGTLSKLLRENGIQAVPHGFRSSFRDWAGETNQPRQLAESALAHRVGDATEASYFRSDLFELRRPLMDAWDRYLGGAGTVALG